MPQKWLMDLSQGEFVSGEFEPFTVMFFCHIGSRPVIKKLVLLFKT